MTLGEKIQKLRKQSGLSQEALAEKVVVTRQTISKWELDQSTPDLAFIAQLSDLFGVSADYLIREDMEEPNALPTNKKKTFRFTQQTRRCCLIALSATSILAIFVCLICDYFTLGALSWSLVVLISVTAAWCVCVPIFIARKKIVMKTLLTISVILLPYLALLGLLLERPMVFKLGCSVSLVSLVAAWVIYGIFQKCRRHLWRALGLAFLVVIPMVVVVDHMAAAFVMDGNFDGTSDLLNSIITFLLAVACFGMDYLQTHKNRDDGETQ